jgi:hypothetical protein
VSLIVIVSANQVESKKIFENLANVEATDYRLEFEFLRPTQVPDLLDPAVDLIVYNNNTYLNMNVFQQIAGWRKKGCLSSVLMLSKVNDEVLIKSLEPANNMVILEKPYLERDLKGIAHKILKSNQINQRKFRRYDVAQEVSLSSYKTGFAGKTRVLNMSRGGLCIAGGLEGLKSGDLLRVDFELDKINSRRSMNGKVVWVAPENEEVQAGLEFVKDSDVYGHLLTDIG